MIIDNVVMRAAPYIQILPKIKSSRTRHIFGSSAITASKIAIIVVNTIYNYHYKPNIDISEVNIT